MSATSFALAAFQDFNFLRTLLIVFSMPLVAIIYVVDIMSALIGCELTAVWIVVFAAYAGYHSWVETFDEKAMLIWLTSAIGGVILKMQCDGNSDLAMLLQDAPRMVDFLNSS
jgi:hypothetical protein